MNFSLRTATLRSLAIALAFVLTALAGGSAQADEHDEQLPRPTAVEAQAHFDAGNTAFRSAQAKTDPAVQRTEYEVAIKEYLAGVQVESKYHYTFYWNLGHAYRQLGEYTRADHFYKKFLEFAPTRYPLHRTAAEDFRRMMKAELDKAATLAEPTAPAPAVLRAHPQQGLAIGGPPIDGRDVIGRHWYSDRVGWLLVGGGAVGVLAGGGLLLNASSLYDQASEEDIQSMANDLRSRGRDRAIVGGIVGGVGLGLAVVGVIRLASTSDADTRATSFQVTVSPTSFFVRGSF